MYVLKACKLYLPDGCWFHAFVPICTMIYLQQVYGHALICTPSQLQLVSIYFPTLCCGMKVHCSLTHSMFIIVSGMILPLFLVPTNELNSVVMLFNTTTNPNFVCTYRVSELQEPARLAIVLCYGTKSGFFMNRTVLLNVWPNLHTKFHACTNVHVKYCISMHALLPNILFSRKESVYFIPIFCIATIALPNLWCMKVARLLIFTSSINCYLFHGQN